MFQNALFKLTLLFLNRQVDYLYWGFLLLKAKFISGIADVQNFV
ncbi:hypothetical protein ACX16X_05410 [Bacillus cereus]